MPAEATPRRRVLGQGQLNRALMARQWLLRRRRSPPLAAVERLVALQAQEPHDPYVALWTRLDPFAPLALSGLLARRKVVRLALLRSTVHLCSARDARALRPVVQPALDRTWRSSPFARDLAGLDLAAVVAAGRAAVEARPLGLTALGRALAPRWPGRNPLALGQAVRAGAALVQVPPRALWGRSGAAKVTTLEQWTGLPLGSETSPDALVVRYLRAFGPASVRDAQAWSGLTRLGPAFDRLAEGLRRFEDEAGRELFDLPGAPRPPARTPAPPRFLPQFDNVVLGHADRSRLDGERWFEGAMATVGQGFHAPYLLHGRVRGMWKLRREGTRATLRIHPFLPLARADRAALAAEAAALRGFLAPGAPGRVEVAAPAA